LELHSIDTKVPRDEQFAAVKSLLEDGIIRHAGLSNVSVVEIEAASKVLKVVTVQNRYNLIDRSSEYVLDYCESHGIGFIPWAPVATGRLSYSGSIDAIAKAHHATTSQIALAWLLKRSPVMLPIPGTSKSCTWKKMSRQSKSSFRTKSLLPLIEKGERKSLELDPARIGTRVTQPGK
jgi:aryl-alcohol dehydrogenase-like predicted oxidoreductase